MTLLRRAAALALLAGAAAPPAAAQDQEYKYEHVPMILYVVGQPGWDKLPPDPSGKRRLQVYADQQTARDRAGGAPIYRIKRHTLAGTPDGLAFLEATEKDRADKTKAQKDVLEIPISDAASFEATVAKNARTGNDLGPANPNWKTSGQYATKEMKGEYRPGELRDDYGRGTFYFPTEGDPAAVNFMQFFKVHFERQPDGSVLLMQVDPNNPSALRPIDTRGLFGKSPAKEDVNTCIWVMDAEGNFYALAPDWLVGINAQLGLSGINHSSIPAGHRVAGAGHMVIEQGRLKLIDNRSGHYQPSNAMTVQAMNAMQDRGVPKGSYKVGLGNGAMDNPGRDYMALDPQAEEKIRKGELDPPSDPDPAKETRPRVADPERPKVDDSALLQPDEPVERPRLDVDRRAAAAPAAPATAAPEAPVPPPDPAVVELLREKITSRPADRMDAAFMAEVYKMDPAAAKLVGQIMASPEMAAQNARMGQLRKEMDLAVWKEILKARNINVEITNQGKSNGIRSDLDYTLYYVAEEAGIPIADLIKEHGETWKRLHQLDPAQLEIKVMNGDEFYPDWRNESLSEFEHQGRIKEMLGRLRSDPEKYSVPGANKEQVHNRALRDGWTERLGYDPELDKPGVPIDRQVIRDQGLTRDLAARYQGVHPQYNHMNALGNLVQNTGEFFHHTGDGAQDAIRRSKYFNRVINEGLGKRFFANDYAKLHASALPDREQLKLAYLKRALSVEGEDAGEPHLDDATLRRIMEVVDVSMQIELDKTSGKGDYTAKQGEYFGKYRQEAEGAVAQRPEAKSATPEERAAMVLGEQQRLFELDQKLVLAEAVLAGLRHTVARDLTPEGVLRNRVRFDPATQKFVMDDPAGAAKVAFERGTEVALFYELVNGIEDPVLRHDLKKRALTAAPSIEIAEFYGALDQVTHAELDRFIKSEPGNKVQRTIDDLIRKQQERALELAVEKKEKAVAAVKAKGVPVEPTTIAPEAVREHILEGRAWTLSPERRAQFRSAYQALGGRIAGDFREAFVNNATPLMLGSSAVNLVRAWQVGCLQGTLTADCGRKLSQVVFSEAINFMPDYLQTPLTAFDLLFKVKRGDYGGAAWQGSLFGAMAAFPALGHGMLAYNIATGSLEIAHTHFVSRIDKDLTEQALKSRPRNENGGPIPDGALGPARARANRMPDAKESVYNGSPPGFPLFYGLYRNPKAIQPAQVINGVAYSDGTVPEDNLGDEALADSAVAEFGPVIDSILTAERLEPGTPQYRTRAWELKLKFGFDVPFYRRIAKVYEEKYKYVTYIDNWPGRYNPDYLSECKLDVYDWFARQPDGYKAELAGEATGLGYLLSFLRDQTDKMQQMIAEECAVQLARHHEAVTKAAELDQVNRAAFNASMSKAFNAERSLLAAKESLRQRIQADEEKAARQVEKKALELAEKHKTLFDIRYPFTYATEELPPQLEFNARTLPARVKGPVRVTVDQEITGMREGAPGGWRPGKRYEASFKPEADGWVAMRPVTADVRFTAHLLDQDSAEVAQAKLDLPVVLYEPAFSGNVTVTVYGLGEKGDSSLYSGAEVTLGSETRATDNLYGYASFGRLKAGTHAVKVAPRKGDQRHGPGSGSATIVDLLLSADRNGKESASIVVKLPYIPEPKIADNNTGKTTPPGGGTGGGAGPKKPGPGTGTGTDTTGTGGGKTDSASVAATETAIKNLAPLTAKGEKARDDAIAACKYVEAAAAQEQLVATAKQFIASTFPKGAPGEVAKLEAGYESQLEALRKAAAGETAAKEHLRIGLAFVLSKQGEPALAALEAAAGTPDIPPCLHEQVMKVYNDLKADLEKRMKLIDEAVDAANNRCDFAAALVAGEKVEAEDRTLSWVVRELPRIRDLDKRQKAARALVQQAEGLAQQGKYDEAAQIAGQALAQAPECDKAAINTTIEGYGKAKAAAANPTVDQSLILLLDTSGSMGSGGKMESAKQAATDAVKSLGPTTEVALLSYDGGCAGGWRVVQGFTTSHQSIVTAIASLSPGGGTPTAPAIGFAHDYMQKNARSKSAQIILMTDGQNDCGSMTDAGSGLRRGSIPVRMDAVGFGLDPSSQGTRDLGDLVRAAGNGTTYSANSSAELISAFRRAFITSQVKPRDPFVTGAAGGRLADLFQAAVNFLRQNDIRGAVGQFKTAVDQFPNSPAANFNASLAYEAAGQPLQALNHAQKYLQLAPNAFDAGSVRERVVQLQAEQAANPRAIYSPNDCSALYRWAQRESRASGMDAARKARVYDIMTTAQRGDCAAADKAFEGYVNQYGKRP